MNFQKNNFPRENIANINKDDKFKNNNIQEINKINEVKNLYKNENIVKNDIIYDKNNLKLNNLEELYPYENSEANNNIEDLGKYIEDLYGLTEANLNSTFDKDIKLEQNQVDFSKIDLNNEDYEFFN